MKKKSRQDSPAAQAPGAPPQHASLEPGKDGPAPPAAAEGRRSLPAFGFASDLLKKGAAPPAEGEPAAPPAAANPAPAIGREVVEREHSGVAETNLALAADEGDLGRGFDLPGALGADGPNRIFDFADRLAARAEERKSTGPKPRLETCLSFALGGETFAMPVEPVQQIVRISSITRVPHAPRPIRGVTNLRGRVIPVIDLRVRVGLPATEIDRSSRIIAVGSRGRVIGLLVDAVHQVMHLDLNQIQRPPEDVLTLQSDYIAGVYHHGESLILLLDVDRALIVRDSTAA
jgi:purine-binding chemotaxis protein CheW